MKMYSKLRLTITCLRIHYWSHLKSYAKKCRSGYYAILAI